MHKYKLFSQNSWATLLSVWPLQVCRRTGPWRLWLQPLYCSFSRFSCNFVRRPWSLLPTRFAHPSALSPHLCPSKQTSYVPKRCTDLREPKEKHDYRYQITRNTNKDGFHQQRSDLLAWPFRFVYRSNGHFLWVAQKCLITGRSFNRVHSSRNSPSRVPTSDL